MIRILPAMTHNNASQFMIAGIGLAILNYQFIVLLLIGLSFIVLGIYLNIFKTVWLYARLLYAFAFECTSAKDLAKFMGGLMVFYLFTIFMPQPENFSD